MRSICWYLFLITTCGARRYRKANEIGIVNLAEANIRLRCQSLLTDHRDLFLEPQAQFRFKFLDIDTGNRHFWCDAYGLFGFDETFDVFGRAAPSRTNLTWFIRDDGLYLDRDDNRITQWKWSYPPFSTYALD